MSNRNIQRSANIAIIVFLLWGGLAFGAEMPRDLLTSYQVAYSEFTSFGRPNSYELMMSLEETDVVELARRLVDAYDPEGVYAVLLDLFAYLDIPVFSSSDGSPLNSVFLTAADELYLYDFQLELLAKSSTREGSLYPGMLIAGIESAEFDFEDYSVSELLYEVFSATDQAWEGAARRAMESDFRLEDRLPQVVWALTNEFGREIPEIHPVVQFLVLLDLLWEQGETQGTPPANSFGLHPVMQFFEPATARASGGSLCEQLQSLKKEADSRSNKVAIGALKKWAQDRWPKLKKPADAGGKAKDALDILYRMVLQLGYVVELSASPKEVHYQHSSPGNSSMDIKATVEFVLDMGEVAVNCGVLAGYEFPPPGPISGMRVEWTFDDIILGHGEVSGAETTLFGSLGGLQGQYWNTTGSDGTATIKFKPNVEDPRGNYKIVETGVVWARIRGAQKDLVGFIGEALFAIEEVERIWVSYHEKREREPKRPTPFQSWTQRPRILPNFPNF